MKTLIVYESRYGSVKKAVDLLSEKLKDAPDIKTTKEAAKSNLDQYENILIGGSIVMGKIQKSISNFINSKKDILLTKRIVLFLAAAAVKPEEIEKEINDAFPKELRDISLYTVHIGYGYDFNKMNFFYKSIIKKTMNVDKNVIELKTEELDKIAEIINTKG